MRIQQSCHFVKERLGLPSDRELAVVHLVALQPSQKTHAEQRYVEVFDDRSGNIIERELVDADFAQHHGRHSRGAIRGAGSRAVNQAVGIDAGSTRIPGGQRDEAGAGIDEHPDGSSVDDRIDDDMAAHGGCIDDGV